MEFNLQTFLTEMRKEQREDHETLDSKLDSTLAKIAEHETRLVILEGTRTLLKWGAATVIVTVLGLLVDIFVKHN